MLLRERQRLTQRRQISRQEELPQQDPGAQQLPPLLPPPTAAVVSAEVPGIPATSTHVHWGPPAATEKQCALVLIAAIVTAAGSSPWHPCRLCVHTQPLPQQPPLSPVAQTPCGTNFLLRLCTYRAAPLRAQGPHQWVLGRVHRMGGPCYPLLSLAGGLCSAPMAARVGAAAPSGSACLQLWPALSFKTTCSFAPLANAQHFCYRA